ncbi:MAG: YebC/PmpR family DNA-binding transcriptional regulator, partial [Actinomycetota bacterium]|nr:YebC/PmpR family DNA-binding transcriptional regulator [Actinomycetota bacterium]
PSAVDDVRTSLEQAGFSVLTADSPMVSANLVPLDSVDEARSVLRIIDALEDNDDVQDVFANFDIADEVMEGATA